MAQKPETRFRARILPKLKALPNTVVFSIQQVAIRGTPDLFLCVNGHFVALELKKDEFVEPSELQKWNLHQIRYTGQGLAWIVSPENWQAVYSQLARLAKGRGIRE